MHINNHVLEISHDIIITLVSRGLETFDLAGLVHNLAVKAPPMMALFSFFQAGAAVRQQDASSPRLEVLRNRGSPLKHSYTRYVQSSCQHLVQSS